MAAAAAAPSPARRGPAATIVEEKKGDAPDEVNWNITDLRSLRDSIFAALNNPANAAYKINISDRFRTHAVRIVQAILLGQKYAQTPFVEFIANISKVKKGKTFSFENVIQEGSFLVKNDDGTLAIGEYRSKEDYIDIIQSMLPEPTEVDDEIIPINILTAPAMVQTLLILRLALDKGVKFVETSAKDLAIAKLADPVNQLTKVALNVVSLIQQQDERNNQLITQLEYLASRQLGVKFDESKMRDLPDEMKMMIRAQEDES